MRPWSWLVFLCGAPWAALLGLSVAFRIAVPDPFGWARWLVPVVALAAWVPVSSQLARRLPAAGGARTASRWGLGLAGLAGYLGLAVVAAGALMFRAIDDAVEYGRPAMQPDDCGENAAVKTWRSCEGRDHSFMQGRYAYYHGAGTAAPEVCRAFAKLPRGKKSGGQLDQDCDPARPELWSEVACAKVHRSESARCFVCARHRATGDTYHEMLAFDAGCKQVHVHSSINVDPADVPAEVRKGDEKAKQKR